MSYADILEEIPRLTAEQRKGVAQRIMDADAGPTSNAAPVLRAERRDGRLVLVSSRTITQAEVDAILEDFP